MNNNLVNEKKFSGHKILQDNLKLIPEKIQNETKKSSLKPIFTPVKTSNNIIKTSINISKNSDLHNNLGNSLNLKNNNK